jgi:hypothetical protein
MITCWGIKFDTVQDLWEHPRCYVATVDILRNRLRNLTPEEAVIPDSINLLGVKYNNIYKLSFVCDCSRASLYQRLGLIINGRKVSPEQATCPQIWNRLRLLKRMGKYRTVLN